ncbi:chorismate-binding protein [Sanguibacter gelidistatuariae]|nr:chorismate-binding protein [Sanguibacter gelidistatuariae]
MVDLRVEPEAITRGGVWFVVAEFAGPARAWRFADVTRTGGSLGSTPTQVAVDAPAWTGPDAAAWVSSLSRSGYTDAVSAVRDYIRDGEVYQANICRVLSAPLPRTGEGEEPDASALAAILAAGNPAPYQGVIHVPHAQSADGSPVLDPVWVVTASPELFLRVDGLNGTGGEGPAVIISGPIKGTASTAAGLASKDEAENIMITDLVRNDLQRICAPGTVAVTGLLEVEHHPGLVHLVSTVTGELLEDAATAPDVWRTILEATFPPASVSGAPKSSALAIIDELETAPRGPYCGAVGWIDADRGTAELAVGIRTFWWTEDADPRSLPDAATGRLRFGTGAGITWGSDPQGEWEETELKAARLIALASAHTLRP